MSDSNHFLPVFVATGVAVLGCAAAFYFSDSDSSMKRRKTYPIHTKDFDDDLDSYDEPVKQRKKKYLRMGGGRDEEDVEDEEDDEEDDDEDDDEEGDDDEEEGDDDEEEGDEEEDDEDGEPYLVNKRTKKSKGKKPSRR